MIVAHDFDMRRSSQRKMSILIIERSFFKFLYQIGKKKVCEEKQKRYFGEEVQDYKEGSRLKFIKRGKGYDGKSFM